MFFLNQCLYNTIPYQTLRGYKTEIFLKTTFSKCDHQGPYKITNLFVFQLGFPLPPITPEITTLEHTTLPQREPEITRILKQSRMYKYYHYNGATSLFPILTIKMIPTIDATLHSIIPTTNRPMLVVVNRTSTMR